MQEKSTGSDDDMISREMDRVLIGLAKIETGLSRLKGDTRKHKMVLINYARGIK
jgi:hypothetical protein